MFGCMNSNETVHFMFDRFQTESGYDYFVIGNPYEFDHYYDYYFAEDTDYLSDYREKPYNRTGFMLDGSQPTGIWVTAESILNFDIYFTRMVFNEELHIDDFIFFSFFVNIKMSSHFITVQKI